MQTFPFTKHSLEIEYPKSSAQITYGRGYEFASKPRGPDQVLYTLNFRAMFFYLDNQSKVDLTKNPSINMGLLDKFYQEHRLYEKFLYSDPTLGNLVMRFREPLKYKIMEGGRGQVEPFSLRLILQP